MKTMTITGVGGFVGHHLAEQAAANDWNVLGVGYEQTPDGAVAGFLQDYHACDLTSAEAVAKVPFDKADVIVHLAGYPSPAESFTQPNKFISGNTAMFVNICENLLAVNSLARVVMISTGAVYDGRQPMPIGENGNILPTNPYVISKLTMESLAEYYNARGLNCVIARPFNHTGPGQLPGFIVPDLITKTKKHLDTGEPVRVGNLKTRRDYTDVRDVAKAYIALAAADKLENTVYNVCSGKTYSGEEILELVAQALGTRVTDLNVEVDESLIRPTDIKEICGSNDRIKQETGWQPTISVEQTVRDSAA